MTRKNPVLHCPGCNGFGPAWEGDCDGVIPEDFALEHFRYAIPPRIPWRMRLKILAGRGVETQPETAVLESRNIPGVSTGELKDP